MGGANMGVMLLKLDRSGWAVGIGKAGGLFVGTVRRDGAGWELVNADYWTDNTTDNIANAISYWKANSFSREVEV